MQYAAKTDMGKKRKNNEDFYLVNLSKQGCPVFIVADGMGGHNAGEVASCDASKVAEKSILEASGNMRIAIKEAVECANRAVYACANKKENMRGMGTTIDVCVVKDNTLYIGHVGDSRVYAISKAGQMRKLTKDHSVVGMMIDNGSITEEEAKNHPQSNYITRAVGTEPTVEVDIIKEELHKGDTILMCTDGLTNMVSANTVADIINNAESLDGAVDALIEKAKENGGDDNITVIIFNPDIEKGDK